MSSSANVNILPDPSIASTPPASGGTIPGLTGSSYGALAAATFSIQSMMTSLGINYNKQAMDQTDFQQKFNKEQCHSIVAEGRANFNSHLMQAGTSAAGAVISGVSLVGGSDSDLKADQKNAQEKLEGLKAKQAPVRAGVDEIKPMKLGEEEVAKNSEVEFEVKVDGQDRESKVEFEVKGDGQQSGDLKSSDKVNDRKESAQKPAADEGVESLNDTHETLRDHMLRGNFDDVAEDDDVKKAVDSAGAQGADIEQELKSQIENQEKVVNRIQSQISSKENTARLYGDMGKGVVDALGQLGQAHYALKAAQERAQAASAQFSQQLSGQTTSSLQKATADNFSYLASVLNALTQVAAAAAA